MLINMTSLTRPHVATDCAVQFTVMGMSKDSGRVVPAAAMVAQGKGTGVSTARTRNRIAPQATALLPFSAVVVTDVVGTDTAGIRSWSPPV